MSGWRTSVGWKLEQEFATEYGSEGQGFEYFAPGIDFNYSPNNNIKYNYTTGSKTYDVATAGRFSGSWNVNLLLDYNHFKWLCAVFEDYYYDITNNKHIFKKSNRKILRSFSIKTNKLNRVVGGSYDQQVVLLGCVVTSFAPSYESSSSSTVRCRISGNYVNEYQLLADLEETEYEAMEPNSPAKYPVEWGCLQVPDGTPLANNEKTGISLSQSVTTLPSCGTRFDSAFYEGQVQPIQVTSQVYSRKPENWYLRMYSGGAVNSADKTSKFQPYAKGLRPLPSVAIASTSDETGTYSSKIVLSDVFVESLSQNYSAGSEIVDAPSLKAKGIQIQMKTPDVTQNLLSDILGVYTISYALNGGTGTAPSSIVGSPGDKFLVAGSSGITPPSSKVFAGWSYGGKVYNSLEEANAIFTIPTLDNGTAITLTAVWANQE